MESLVPYADLQLARGWPLTSGRPTATSSQVLGSQACVATPDGPFSLLHRQSPDRSLGPLLSGGRRGAFLTIRQPAVYYVEPTYPFVYICGSGAGAMGQPWRLFAVQ